MKKQGDKINHKEFFSTLKDVFSKPKYIAITILVAFVFYSINVLILNFENFASFYNLLGFWGLVKSLPTFFFGLKNLVLRSSFVFVIALSFLIGILFSLIHYRTKMIKNYAGNKGFLASSGIFLGVLAPGCAACGLGLLPLLGISATVLTTLPYDGLELSILGVGILSFSIFKLTKDINKGISCEIPIKK
ncbi:MAG: hypothetical protein WDZ69_00825 [Candidatus Pacearchaeota archaeon]